MHMADALLSPAVGVAMWAASAATLAYSARWVRQQGDERAVPLMGVLGAFVFAAQMLNFTIPATGSSGHLGGGLLLAVLLGPHAAFIVIASVLSVQALFFADGGLLALGANIVNLGLFPCFVAYPLVYRVFAAGGMSRGSIVSGSVAAAIVGLQLGAIGVVLETVASGISSLPLDDFVVLMLPIHLAIGLAEGLATAAVLLFIRAARPELLERGRGVAAPRRPLRPLLAAVAAAALLTGGSLSWFSSTAPDGLEWSIEQAAGAARLPAPAGGLHARLAALQQHLAVLPDYDFAPAAPAAEGTAPARWPELKPGTSLAGVVGGVVTLGLVSLLAWVLRRRRRASASTTDADAR